VHGLGSSKDSPRNVVIAERLVDAGIAAVLFDLSGHGDSTAYGETIDDYARDLAAVVRWMAVQDDLDTSRIGISGSSLGGLVAIEAVRQGLVRPRTMVLRAPPVDPGGFDGLAVETLVVAGSNDPLLPQIRAAARGRPGITLKTVPGATHLFEEEGTLEVATTLTVAWFRDELRGEGDVAGAPARGVGE
jgi:putative phosphoribosyl transferase